MARPRSHSSTLRTRRVVFRLTEAEFVRLSHKAASLNTRVNECARILALAETEVSTPASRPQLDPALLRQLYHVGHNLNQLTKNAHIFGRISPRVAQLCGRIEALMDEAMNKENDQ